MEEEMKSHTLAALALAAVALVAMPTLSDAQVTINLRTGAVSGASPGVSAAAALQTSPYPSSTCAAGNWFTALAIVDLNPALGYGQPRTAYFTVEYEGTPWGWTVNLGDSPTNDGYGGNSGGAEHAAEIQVLNQQLTVYNDPKIPGQVDSMLNQQVSLTNGSLKFGIADEILAVGQPRTILATPVTKTLFQIPDSNLASNDPARSLIYAGFNRVVSGRPDRYGCGARSVTIWTGTGGV
jgi:hypothetical protein